MKVEYDKYYQTENLFGDPYQELIDFYSSKKNKRKLLDVGCGQGRDAIPLARMGYEVTGIDHSVVGIEQLNQIAKKENLPLIGIVANIYEYKLFNGYDYILLDSMFHFGKREKDMETNLLRTIFKIADVNTLFTICIQNSGNKAKILDSVVSKEKYIRTVSKINLVYEFKDKNSDHSSKSDYIILTVEKIE